MLAGGASLAGISSNTARGTNGARGTTATFLAGTTTGPVTISEDWRTATPGETLDVPVLSDVVDLSGLTDGTIYVIELSYNPADLTPFLLGNQNLLNLGELVGGNWTLAAANDAGGAKTRYTTSWVGADQPLVDGDYGVDTANHEVWAVLDHDDVVLAVIPEPASIGILGLGAMGLLARRRRRSVSL